MRRSPYLSSQVVNAEVADSLITMIAYSAVQSFAQTFVTMTFSSLTPPTMSDTIKLIP